VQGHPTNTKQTKNHKAKAKTKPTQTKQHKTRHKTKNSTAGGQVSLSEEMVT